MKCVSVPAHYARNHTHHKWMQFLLFVPTVCVYYTARCGAFSFGCPWPIGVHFYHNTHNGWWCDHKMCGLFVYLFGFFFVFGCVRSFGWLYTVCNVICANELKSAIKTNLCLHNSQAFHFGWDAGQTISFLTENYAYSHESILFFLLVIRSCVFSSLDLFGQSKALFTKTKRNTKRKITETVMMSPILMSISVHYFFLLLFTFLILLKKIIEMIFFFHFHFA